MDRPRINFGNVLEPEETAMARSKWWRWSDRARMLLTLELAIVLPAAALIGFSVWNLRSIQRDRAVEAAIQRDFSQVLKIAEKKINEKARKLVAGARAEFPCPDDKGAIATKLDAMLRNHPEFAYAFLYDKKTNTFVGRIQPSRANDPALHAEGEKWFEMSQAWVPQDAKEIAEKLRWYEEMEGTPSFSFYSGKVKRNGQQLYQTMVFFIPPELEKHRAAVAALAFEPEFLREKFLPKALEAVLTNEKDGSGSKNQPVMMIHLKKEYEPMVASAGWDGGKPEVERNFEDVFPGLVMAIKYRGTTIEALSQRFLRNSFLILGGLSLFLALGIWHTYRNVSREMAVAKLKSDFVANVSHELRTPLALIRLYAETLELGRLSAPEKREEYYRIIRKESERLTALINNILDFSRIEAGRKEYDFRDTNLAELVRATLEAYRFQIEQHGFSFQEKIEENVPPVRVDREAIARSLLNLINNAIKYSPEEKYLGVKLYRSNGSVKLEVEDHGIGIPRNEQAKIFDKFYRAGDPLVHNTKGSGLGLSLVQHIVQAHGGQVSVESAPGKGSRFTIALPLLPGANNGLEASHAN
jgi:signal transduction histidine kinase